MQVDLDLLLSLPSLQCFKLRLDAWALVNKGEEDTIVWWIYLKVTNWKNSIFQSWQVCFLPPSLSPGCTGLGFHTPCGVWFRSKPTQWGCGGGSKLRREKPCPESAVKSTFLYFWLHPIHTLLHILQCAKGSTVYPHRYWIVDLNWSL